ncbi:quinone-dependent dihydroorotate dehydrogenase [bacterium]|nr:quinone-dependent dihydroorotate dehydrogenase [bacterium]
MRVRLIKLFHVFPPELSHLIVIHLLKIYQWLGLRFFRKRPIHFSYTLQIAHREHLQFPNRLGLAAGFDKNAEVSWALIELGLGFVEVGTVTPRPQPGNPRPRVWRLPPDALVNHFGFNSCGLDAFKSHLLKCRSKIRAPVLANIGKNRETPLENAVDDYRLCIAALEDSVDGFVMNISSPNTPGLRSLQSLPFLQEVVRVFSSKKPTWIKLSPDLDPEEFEKICDWVRDEVRVTGLVVANTSSQLAQEYGFSQGGLSGPPIFERNRKLVEQARRLLGNKKNIIGVGGISSLKDALAMREAGADLVEVYTAFVYQGPKMIREISRHLQ